MNVALGIDAVEIERFAHWHTYSRLQLKRIFSEPEIEYCLSSPALSAQRFAARFAAREAFLKALSTLFPDHRFALLMVCRHLEITRNPNGSPVLTINWPLLLPNLINAPVPTCTLSWTHTKSIATSIIQITSYK